MTETLVAPEVQAGAVADGALNDREQRQDRRLRRWAKWFVGGLGVQVLGVGAAFVPFVGIPLALSLWSLGGAAELVGTVGVIGNVIQNRKGK